MQRAIENTDPAGGLVQRKVCDSDTMNTAGTPTVNTSMTRRGPLSLETVRDLVRQKTNPWLEDKYNTNGQREAALGIQGDLLRALERSGSDDGLKWSDNEDDEVESEAGAKVMVKDTMDESDSGSTADSSIGRQSNRKDSETPPRPGVPTRQPSTRGIPAYAPPSGSPSDISTGSPADSDFSPIQLHPNIYSAHSAQAGKPVYTSPSLRINVLPRPGSPTKTDETPRSKNTLCNGDTDTQAEHSSSGKCARASSAILYAAPPDLMNRMMHLEAAASEHSARLHTLQLSVNELLQQGARTEEILAQHQTTLKSLQSRLDRVTRSSEEPDPFEIISRGSTSNKTAQGDSEKDTASRGAESAE